ncbi:MAG: heme-binding beta-barrel domain-containing protein [Pseudomonadales bacterium]|nr:heme-binding beta-barrel domain-containing protein [Pseudomonadales bacterium]
MAEKEINYGPLTGLIGTWKGDRGIDIAPEPDGTERSPYYETIVFEAAGDVDNAETQILTILRYHQAVFRKSNDEQFHDQVGYLTWEETTGVITHSFVIPRGVGVVAGGKVISEEEGKITIKVDAADGDKDWGVSQAPFMRDNARTKSFTQTIVLDGDDLSYEERTLLDIYGREFDHVDKSKLTRVS